MITIAHALFFVLILTFSLTSQVAVARDDRKVVIQVPFPKEIPFHIVVRDPNEMKETILSRVNPDNPAIFPLGFDEFKNQARGWPVTLYTGRMCNHTYDQRYGRWLTLYTLEFNFFKGNRMYYTRVDMYSTLKKAVEPGSLGHCSVDPFKQHINVRAR